MPQTSESASLVERRKGNKIFENAKKWGLSYPSRKGLLDNAIASYIRAENLASNSDEYSSASKNHGKAAWKLYCLVKEKQGQNIVLYLMEATKFFCVSYEKGSGKQDEWRDDLLTSLNLCMKELLDICMDINDVDEKRRILSSFDEIVTVKAANVRLKLNLAYILFHDAVKLLIDKDYKGALNRFKDCYRPIEEAKTLNDSESSMYADEFRVLEQYVYFHTCSAESIQACEYGNELLNSATLEKESINTNLVWDAIDWYKRATILTRELDLEQEAIALSHLGFVYNKVLKLKYKSKEYYMKCFILAESMKPRTFFTIDWYQQCVAALKEFQLQERLSDEKVEEKKREIKLAAIKEELEDLKKNNTGKCEILIHVYNAYPPKNPKWKKPSEEKIAKWVKMGTKELKKVLLKGICDYHPDKIDIEKHGERWKTLCEEITKLLTAHYEYLKVPEDIIIN